MKEATIVIPAFKQEDYLKQCLFSVLRNTQDIDFNVVVVNDAHDPDSDMGRYVESLPATNPNIKIVTLPSPNHGHRGATEAGLKYVDGKYLVLMNDDVEIPAEQPDWLRNLIDFIAIRPEVASVTPSSYHKDMTVYWIGITRYPGPHDFLRVPFGHPNLPKEPVDTLYNNMACFVTRSDFFLNEWGFNIIPKEVTHYGSDSHWSFVVTQKLGLKHYCLPGVWVYHYNIFGKRR